MCREIYDISMSLHGIERSCRETFILSSMIHYYTRDNSIIVCYLIRNNSQNVKPSIFFNRAIATFTPNAHHMNSISHNVYIYLYIAGNIKNILTILLLIL